MKNKVNKIVLLASFTIASIGFVLKIQGHKLEGDVFLVLSTLLWFYIIYKIVRWFITD